MSNRTIVYAGLVAAAYAVASLALAPLSFGPLQFRVGSLLVPLALLSPAYGLGLAVGNGVGNLASPFGAWDIIAMPIAMFAITQVGYRFRAVPWLTLTLMAAAAALAIAALPLHLGGGIPIWPTVALIFVSLEVAYLVGWYAIWRNIR